jgi:hypothetical protein
VQHPHRFSFTKLNTYSLDTIRLHKLARFICTTALLQQLDLYIVDDDYSIVSA